jgi:hypothetical protein
VTVRGRRLSTQVVADGRFAAAAHDQVLMVTLFWVNTTMKRPSIVWHSSARRDLLCAQRTDSPRINAES